MPLQGWQACYHKRYPGSAGADHQCISRFLKKTPICSGIEKYRSKAVVKKELTRHDIRVFASFSRADNKSPAPSTTTIVIAVVVVGGVGIIPILPPQLGAIFIEMPFLATFEASPGVVAIVVAL